MKCLDNFTVAAFKELPYLMPSGLAALSSGALDTSIISAKRVKRGNAVDYLAIVLSALNITRFNLIIVPWVNDQIALLSNGTAHIGPANAYMTQERYSVIQLLDTYQSIQLSSMMHPGKDGIRVLLLKPYSTAVWVVGVIVFAFMVIFLTLVLQGNFATVVHNFLFYKNARAFRRGQITWTLVTVWSLMSMSGLAFYKSIFYRTMAARGNFHPPFRTVYEVESGARNRKFAAFTHRHFRDIFCNVAAERPFCHNHTYPDWLTRNHVTEFSTPHEMIEHQLHVPSSVSIGLDSYHVHYYAKLYPQFHITDVTGTRALHLGIPVSRLCYDLGQSVEMINMKIMQHGLFLPFRAIYWQTEQHPRLEYGPITLEMTKFPIAYYFIQAACFLIFAVIEYSWATRNGCR